MIRLRETYFSKEIRLAAVLMLALSFLVFALSAFAPANAWARSYASGPVEIKGVVQPNGDLAVTEQRTFTFEGSYSCVWWYIEDLPDGAKVKPSSVTMTTANGTLEMLEVEFQKEWRSAGGPDKLAWSYDSGKNAIYAFFDADNAEFTFTLSYTVTNVVQVYSDTAELYWKFVPDGWAVDSRDVSAEIVLPLPQNETAVAGDNVKAWGHGDLTGSVNIGSEGSVSYKVSNVRAGNYAEARIAFPTSWVNKVKSGDVNYHTSAHLEKIQQEEEQWSAGSNNFRITQILSLLGSLALALLAIGWAVWRFFKYGRELKPNFTDTYWRDEPLEGAHPAVVGRLIRFDDESSQDFAATLLNLANLGALSITPVTATYKKLIGSGSYTDYALRKTPDFDVDTLGELDRKAYDIIFGYGVDEQGALLLSSLKTRAKDDAERFSIDMQSWQGLLRGEVIKADVVEGYSSSKRNHNTAMAIAVVSICVWLGLVFDNIMCSIPGLIAAIVLVLLGRFMPRRTQKGADAYARAMALKKWLCEFSLLNERPFTDVKVWGKLMVYAYVLGVASEAANQLRAVGYAPAPRTDGSYGYYDSGFWWYAPAIMHASSGQGQAFDFGSFTSYLDYSLEESLHAVQSALSEVGGDGGFSSGGGFGGGFSGGGGGGFGGGGGAR